MRERDSKAGVEKEGASFPPQLYNRRSLHASLVRQGNEIAFLSFYLHLTYILSFSLSRIASGAEKYFAHIHASVVVTPPRALVLVL